MKNTVTMAELMKKVTAYGQPQNLDEGFASDAQRRAAFASGYKEKGKKDKKEETLGEIKLSPPMIAKIKKTFEPLRDKKIGPSTQNKLMQTMDKIDKDKQTLVDLMNADIPFVSKLAVARLISKHNMKADQINKLRKEEVELDEQLDYIVVDKDNKIITRQKNKVDAKEFEKFANSKSYKKPLKKPTKVLPIRSTDKKKIGDTVIGIGMEEVELDEKYDLYHKDFSSAMQHAYDYAKKKMGITVDPKEIDSKVATGPKKPSEGKTNKYRLKGKGGNLQIQVYNKGGSKPFELNMYKEESESMNDIKEWFTKNKCDVKVREIHEGSNVYQAYVPISKTIPNNLRYLTLENQYGMIPEDVENLDDINYKNIKETSITMNGDFWNKLLTAYEEK